MFNRPRYRFAVAGFPIRTSSDQSLYTAPRGLSQCPTSFFGTWRQGILRKLLVASPRDAEKLILFCFGLHHQITIQLLKYWFTVDRRTMLSTCVQGIGHPSNYSTFTSYRASGRDNTTRHHRRVWKRPEWRFNLRLMPACRLTNFVSLLTRTRQTQWRWRDLNPRPSPCKGAALPLSYIPSRTE